MNKLLITHGATLTGDEWIRFDIRSEDLSQNRWASIKVEKSDEMIPFQCFEAEKDMLIGNLCAVIDLLKDYLEQIQKEEK